MIDLSGTWTLGGEIGQGKYAISLGKYYFFYFYKNLANIVIYKFTILEIHCLVPFFQLYKIK